MSTSTAAWALYACSKPLSDDDGIIRDSTSVRLTWSFLRGPDVIKEIVKEILFPLIKSHPKFLIIGAQKAGTTSLYNYLCEHPELISNNTWKEVHFFDKRENINKGLGSYLGSFPSYFKARGKITFEATPDYLFYDWVPKRIKNLVGSIKLIAILREPASRAFSAWKMYHSFKETNNAHLRNLYDPRSFDEAIADEMNETNYPDNYEFYYLDRGKYALQLQRYFSVFGRNNVLVIDFNSFATLDKLLATICDFIKIPRFSDEKISELSQKIHNKGTSHSHIEYIHTVETLKDYFSNYNDELFELLGHQFDW